MNLKIKLTFLSLITTLNCLGSIVILNGLTKNHDLPSTGKTAGKVVLKNIGNKPESIKVYFHDLSTDCFGKIDYQTPGQNPNSLFPFVHVNNTDYILQPEEEFELLYDINLSDNTLTNGSLWTLMMIEVVNPISKSKQASGLEIGSKIRYAIQLIGNVGKKNAEGLSFANVKIGKNQEQQRVLEVSLSNAGKFLALPNVNIQIFDQNGKSIKTLEVPSKKIYPSNCQYFTLPIDEIPKGKYQAVLLAEYLEESIGVNVELEL